MSRTQIHTEKGKCNNDVPLTKKSFKYQKQVDRHNFDKGIDRDLRNKKQEKRLKKELKLNEYKFRVVTDDEKVEWAIGSYDKLL